MSVANVSSFYKMKKRPKTNGRNEKTPERLSTASTSRVNVSKKSPPPRDIPNLDSDNENNLSTGGKSCPTKSTPLHHRKASDGIFNSTPISCARKCSFQESPEEIIWDCHSPGYQVYLQPKKTTREDDKKVAKLAKCLISSSAEGMIQDEPLFMPVRRSGRIEGKIDKQKSRQPMRNILKKNRAILSKEFENLVNKIKDEKAQKLQDDRTKNNASNPDEKTSFQNDELQPNFWSDDQIYFNDSFILRTKTLEEKAAVDNTSSMENSVKGEKTENDAWSDDELFTDDSFIRKATQINTREDANNKLNFIPFSNVANELKKEFCNDDNSGEMNFDIITENRDLPSAGKSYICHSSLHRNANTRHKSVATECASVNSCSAVRVVTPRTLKRDKVTQVENESQKVERQTTGTGDNDAFADLDNDSLLFSEEVLVMLDQFESELTSSQKRSQEEIAKNRERALLRRSNSEKRRVALNRKCKSKIN